MIRTKGASKTTPKRSKKQKSNNELEPALHACN